MKKTFQVFIKENRLLIFLLALVTLLCYGFTVTHYAIGVDNTYGSFYYNQGGLIAQGRLTLSLIDKLIMPLDGTPFWSNLMGTIILYIAVLTWCGYLFIVSKEKLPKPALIIFGTVMISYPMINETFIYNPWSFSISYLLCALSLIAYEKLSESFGWGRLISVFVFLFFLISLNESFAPVFLLGLLFSMILRYVFNPGSEPKLNASSRYFFLAVLILFAAAVTEHFTALALKRILVYQFGGGANNDIEWMQYGILFSLKSLSIGIIYRYFLAAYWYFPITLLLTVSVVAVVLAVYFAIKRKRAIILLLFLGLFLALIALSLVKGHVTHYRTCSAFAPFIAFILMVCFSVFNKKPQQIIFVILMLVLVINQTRILNNWFVNDYMRYENDKEIALHTAKDLESGFDVTKPVVFAGDTAMAPQVKKVASNGLPIIGWATNAGQGDSQMHQFMLMHGHEYVSGTQSMIDNGRMLAESQAEYPKAGYIVDYGEFIVVNFGDNYRWRLEEKEKAVQTWFISVMVKVTHMDKTYLEGQLATAIND